MVIRFEKPIRVSKDHFQLIELPAKVTIASPMLFYREDNVAIIYRNNISVSLLDKRKETLELSTIALMKSPKSFYIPLYNWGIEPEDIDLSGTQLVCFKGGMPYFLPYIHLKGNKGFLLFPKKELPMPFIEELSFLTDIRSFDNPVLISPYLFNVEDKEISNALYHNVVSAIVRIDGWIPRYSVFVRELVETVKGTLDMEHFGGFPFKYALIVSKKVHFGMIKEIISGANSKKEERMKKFRIEGKICKVENGAYRVYSLKSGEINSIYHIIIGSIEGVDVSSLRRISGVGVIESLYWSVERDILDSIEDSIAVVNEDGIYVVGDIESVNAPNPFVPVLAKIIMKKFC